MEERKLMQKMYFETLKMRENAWEQPFDKSIELRKKEQILYEKYKLLEGIQKARKKVEKNER